MDAFHTLAEIAVAIAGFSSLVIAFRGRASDWSEQDYLGLGYVVCWSIGAIFLSLLPIILGEFGVILGDASRIGLLTLPVYMLGVGGALGYVRRSLAREPESRRRPLWETSIGPGKVGKAMSASSLSIVAIGLLAGFELLRGPAHAWYAVAIVLLMAHAVAEMGAFVLLSEKGKKP